MNVKECIQQSDGNIQIAKVDNSNLHIYFNNNTAEKTLKGEKKFIHYFDKQIIFSATVSVGNFFLVYGVMNIFYFLIRVTLIISDVAVDEALFDYISDSSIMITVGAAIISFGLMMKKDLKKD